MHVQPPPAANTMDPPTIPLAPMKRMQARFNPLADGLMYVVVFVGGFVGVGCRHALDMLLPSVSRDAHSLWARLCRIWSPASCSRC